MWKLGERKEEVPAPITLPPVDEQLQVELCQRYEEATDVLQPHLLRARGRH